MKRHERLERVREDLLHGEREQAARLRAAQQRVHEAQQRLRELQGYGVEYRRAWSQRALGGVAAPALRDFQAFLCRLDEAVRQQQASLTRAEAECEFARNRWSEAAVHVRAVGTVVERWRAHEQQVEQRREQRAIDERAQRVHSQKEKFG